MKSSSSTVPSTVQISSKRPQTTDGTIFPTTISSSSTFSKPSTTETSRPSNGISIYRTPPYKTKLPQRRRNVEPSPIKPLKTKEEAVKKWKKSPFLRHKARHDVSSSSCNSPRKNHHPKKNPLDSTQWVTMESRYELPLNVQENPTTLPKNLDNLDFLDDEIVFSTDMESPKLKESPKSIPKIQEKAKTLKKKAKNNTPVKKQSKISKPPNSSMKISNSIIQKKEIQRPLTRASTRHSSRKKKYNKKDKSPPILEDPKDVFPQASPPNEQEISILSAADFLTESTIEEKDKPTTIKNQDNALTESPIEEDLNITKTMEETKVTSISEPSESLLYDEYEEDQQAFEEEQEVDEEDEDFEVYSSDEYSSDA